MSKLKERQVQIEDEGRAVKERRRYALLQTAAVIATNERFQIFHDFRGTSQAARVVAVIDATESLLAEIEKREEGSANTRAALNAAIREHRP